MYKMAINTYLSLTTLNVNNLNVDTNQKTEWINGFKKQDHRLPTRDSLQI